MQFGSPIQFIAGAHSAQQTVYCRCIDAKAYVAAVATFMVNYHRTATEAGVTFCSSRKRTRHAGF